MDISSKESLANHLRDKLNRFFDGSTKRTAASLSRSCGVDPNAIRRLVQGETKVLAEANAYALMVYFEGVGKAVEVIGEVYPNWAKPFNDVASINISDKDKDIDWDEVSLALVDLPIIESGLSQEYMFNTYGKKKTLAAAQKLIDAGLITYAEESKTYHSKNFHDSNARFVVKRIEIDASSFDHDRFGRGPFYDRLTGAYNERTADSMKAAVKRCLAELRELDRKDKSIPGKKSKFVKISAVGDFFDIDEVLK